MAIQTDGLLSPFLQSRRLKAALPHIGGHVLDVGCGPGPLAAHVPADRYVGIDIDAAAVTEAQRRFPDHDFRHGDAPPASMTFDTVVSLAVLEHVPDPVKWLATLVEVLGGDGTIVLTTPHAQWEFLHGLGSKVRLASRHAADEHDQLFDRSRLDSLAAKCGLTMVTYRRFLGPLNQLAVMRRPPGTPRSANSPEHR